jgi:hypothetical protein
VFVDGAGDTASQIHWEDVITVSDGDYFEFYGRADGTLSNITNVTIACLIERIGD